MSFVSSFSPARTWTAFSWPLRPLRDIDERSQVPPLPLSDQIPRAQAGRPVSVEVGRHTPLAHLASFLEGVLGKGPEAGPEGLLEISE